MKPVYVLTLCLGLLEGTDAIAIPGFVSPKVGYSTTLAHDEKKPAPPSGPAPPAGSAPPASPAIEPKYSPKPSSRPVYGAWTPKSQLTDLPSVRRSVKTGESYGSDDDAEDESDDDSEDKTSDASDFDGAEVAYLEPMMAPTYIHTGTLPVDKPEAAPKTKPSKVSTKSKSKSGSKSTDDTVETARHGSDDDSESGSSGKKKQKGKDKNKGKDDDSGRHTGDDDASKSRTKSEDSTSTRTRTSTSASSPATLSTSVTPRPSSGRHSGDDDKDKSRTKTEDSHSSGSPKPTSQPGDSSKGKGKGKGKGKDGSGKKSGDDDATKSSSKKRSKDDSAKPASKKSSDSSRHPRAFTTHQSGTTFDPNSAKGGGKNGPGYYKPFDPPKLNSGDTQAVPPKSGATNNKSTPKVKPKTQRNGKVGDPLSLLHKREQLLSLRAAAPFESVAIDRAKWKVTCDSVHQGDECQNAIDGKADTFWQWI
jgi:galactose oxidase